MPNRDELRTLAADIAEHLPDHWEAKPGHAAIKNPDGMELCLYNGRYGRPGEISGNLPVLPYRQHTNTEHSKRSIGVTLTRSPRVIAREITRRLLPDYEPLYRELAEERRRYLQSKERSKALADQARKLFPSSQRVHPATPTHVELTLRLDAEQLEAVATLLNCPE